MNSSHIRTLAAAGMFGGICWIAMAISALLTPAEPGARVILDDTSEYIGFGNFAVALALTVCMLLALYLRHRPSSGVLGRVAPFVAMAGCAGQCVVISTITITGEEPSWFGIAAPAAILTWFVGSIGFGVAIRRARQLPSWVGAVLPVVTLLAIVGSEAGTSVLIGAFLLIVGRRLVSEPTTRSAPHVATAGAGA